jgi:RNA polymerase sigma-70 factor (ECF subfamily)
VALGPANLVGIPVEITGIGPRARGEGHLVVGASGATFEERSLARRLQAGDESALAELYDGYSPLVFGLALRVVRDRGAAEDITQDVFVLLWQRPENFDPQRGSLRSYVGTITHRRAVDHVRSEEARRRREHKISTRVTPSPEIDDGLLRGFDADAVRRVVTTLPSAQREALELAYFHGLTYREVAETLGVPEGTAKSRLRLALARLAHVLQPELSEQST